MARTDCRYLAAIDRWSLPWFRLPWGRITSFQRQLRVVAKCYRQAWELAFCVPPQPTHPGQPRPCFSRSQPADGYQTPYPSWGRV